MTHGRQLTNVAVGSTYGRAIAVAATISLTFWLTSVSAHAEDELRVGVVQSASSPAAESRPWADGVSEAEQRLAIEKFEAGNALLDEALFAPALATYREAIRHWDHPGIRYNMAICLINLEQPLAAHENLERALRWGAAPLEKAAHRQLLTYKRLLDGRLATLEIRCDDADATVDLDGRRALVCPGEKRVVVEAGAHLVVAAKPGYLTRTQRVQAVGGKEHQIETTLMSLSQATVSKRKWAPWKPWAVAGTGAALLALAVPLEIKARESFESYCRAHGAICDGQDCPHEALPPEVREIRTRAQWQNRAAIGLFALGGATLTTAAALLWTNRPRTERRDYADRGSVTPWVGVGAGGVTGTLRF